MGERKTLSERAPLASPFNGTYKLEREEEGKQTVNGDMKTMMEGTNT